jgi:hypothetical protein
LNHSAGVNGVSIWYPEQLPNDIQPYPPAIARGGGATIENITFVNPYIGYTTYVDGTTARPFVRNVHGTPLKTGIEFDCLADIGRIETVHFSPDYWADSGLANAPTAGEHAAWIYNNGTGMIVRRIDWSYSCYVTVEGYNIGLALRPGRYDGKVPDRGVHRSQRLRRIPIHPVQYSAGEDRHPSRALGRGSRHVPHLQHQRLQRGAVQRGARPGADDEL